MDEYEKFQKEVKEAEDEQAINENQRLSTPPDGENEFTDDDGTRYKWDKALKVWVPQVIYYFLSSLFPRLSEV